MAMNKKLAVGLWTFAGLLVGIGLGYLFFAPKKPSTNGSMAGKPCKTPDGKDGKTDATGTCKA